jgi:hypothetical protein
MDAANAAHAQQAANAQSVSAMAGIALEVKKAVGWMSQEVKETVGELPQKVQSSGDQKCSGGSGISNTEREEREQLAVLLKKFGDKLQEPLDGPTRQDYEDKLRRLEDKLNYYNSAPPSPRYDTSNKWNQLFLLQPSRSHV